MSADLQGRRSSTIDVVRPLASALFGLTLASTVAVADVGAQPAAEPARPMNRCQIQGDHVSGVVAVDLSNGTRTELPIVDAAATVAMAPRLEDVVFHVTEPLMFHGTLVPGERGGPAAFSARGYRSADRAIRLAAGTPLEMRLAAADDHVTLRATTIYHEGSIEFDVPCSELRAGSPSASVHRTEPSMRGEFIVLTAGTILRATADPSSPQIAGLRVDRGDHVTVKGRIVSRAAGFAHVTFSVGPVTVDGFVAESNVESAGRNLVPVHSPQLQIVGTINMLGSERETRVVTLPPGTPVFASAMEPRPWATVTAPFRVSLSRRIGSTGRFAVTDFEANVVTRRCRNDGVGDIPSCEVPASAPRIGLFTCDGGDCAAHGYVDQP